MSLSNSPLLSSVVFSALGIFIFIFVFYLLDKLTPYDLWREINEKNNMALAILVGSGMIGLALIIASAIHS
jgi:uncharacterized membrane protein YjfL (UPF0719 family)